jgi:hypothetical protein
MIPCLLVTAVFGLGACSEAESKKSSEDNSDPTQASCDGKAHRTQENRTRYETETVSVGGTCKQEIQTRTCNNGTWSTWSGTFEYPECTPETAHCEQRSFQEWCELGDALDAETKKTIDTLLWQVDTDDCATGAQLLANLDKLPVDVRRGFVNAGNLCPLTSLTKLRSIALETWSSSLADLASLPELQGLELYDFNTTDADLSGLPTLKELKRLFMENLVEVTNVGMQQVAKTTSLRDVTVFNLSKVESLQMLRELPLLETLTVWEMEGLTGGIPNEVAAFDTLFELHLPGLRDSFDFLKDLRNLKVLRVYGLSKEFLPENLSQLTDLADLSIQLESSLQDLSALPKPDGIYRLAVGVPTLDGIERFSNVEILEMQTGSTFSSLEPLRNLKGLRVFSAPRSTWVPDNEKIQSLVGIEGIDTLRELRVPGNALQDVASLSEGGFPPLLVLDLSNNQKLQDLNPIADLQSLEELNLTGLNQVQDFSFFENLNLMSLNVHNTNLVDLRVLSHMSNLESLTLGKSEATDLRPLSDLDALTSISLSPPNKIVEDHCPKNARSAGVAELCKSLFPN